MKNHEGFEKFTWTITNFSSLGFHNKYSETLSLDDHKWRINIIPDGNNLHSLFIYLDAGPYGKFLKFKLILVNQLNHRRNLTKEFSHTFNSSLDSWNVDLGNIFDSGNGFIVNDICIVELHILVHNSDNKKEVDEYFMCIYNELVQNPETVDFIPLLMEVCLRYPLESQRFTEWAFVALGRVLHFLNTKKVRDMDDDACNHLKTLWEELEICGFDLSWLKPKVQSALDMKSCVEKVLAVKRIEEDVSPLEEEVAILEKETKILRTKIIEAEANLEIRRRELLKTKGFIDCYLDAELWKP